MDLSSTQDGNAQQKIPSAKIAKRLATGHRSVSRTALRHHTQATRQREETSTGETETDRQEDETMSIDAARAVGTEGTSLKAVTAVMETGTAQTAKKKREEGVTGKEKGV